MTTTYPGTLDSYADKVDGVDDVMAAHVNDMQDAIEAVEAHSQAMSLIKVRNTSGATVAANDVGYIDEAGEFQTTATAYLDVTWAVVVAGAANNSDIVVARRGRVTVELNGNCSAGDFLYTSTTTGQAQPQSYMRPEVFAVAITANSGGAGGTCEALLLTGTALASTNLTYDIYTLFGGGSDSDFVATIATLPGGAVLTYNAPSSGDEKNLVPTATTQYAKMRLYNSTRSTYALISNCVTGTNTLTLTANVPAGWQVGDTITIRSQTNTAVIGASYFIDFELTGGVAAEARSIGLYVVLQDTGAASELIVFHPWATNAASKQFSFIAQVTAVWAATANGPLPLIQRRFCLLWTGSGAGTFFFSTRMQSETLAVP